MRESASASLANESDSLLKPDLDRRVVVALFVLFAFEAATFSWLARPIIDEGIYLTASKLLYQGQLPYRDFPFSQGPALPIVYGALLAPFDVIYWPGRFISLLGCLTAAGAAAAIARRFAGNWGAGIAIVLAAIDVSSLWVSTTIRIQAFSTPLVMLAALALMRAPRNTLGWALAPSLLLWSFGARLTNGLAFAVISLWIAYALRHDLKKLCCVIGAVIAQAPLAFAPVLLAPGAALDHVILGQLGRLERRGFQSRPGFEIFKDHIYEFFGPHGDFFPVVLLTLAVVVSLALRIRAGWRPSLALPIRDPGMAQVVLLGIGFLLYVMQWPLENAYLTYFVPTAMMLGPAIAITFGSWIRSQPRVSRAAGAILGAVLFASLLDTSAGWRRWIGTGDASMRHFHSVADELSGIAGPNCSMVTFDTHLAAAAGCVPLRGLEYGSFSFYPWLARDEAESRGFVNHVLLVERIREQQPELIVMKRPEINARSVRRGNKKTGGHRVDANTDLRAELGRSYTRLDSITIASGRIKRNPLRHARNGTVKLDVYVHKSHAP
jgi:hypothetical protein